MEMRKQLKGFNASESMRTEFARAVSNRSITELTDYDRVSKDLYTVLFDKTKGTPHRKVDNVRIGDGVLAYWRLHWWYTEVSKAEMSSQRNTLAQPMVCRKDEDIVSAIEKWEKSLKDFEDRGGKPLEDHCSPLLFFVVYWAHCRRLH